MKSLFYEDLEVGESFDLGSVTVTRADIVAFAETYDPRPYHLDEAAGREAGHGGLIASGFHTLCLANYRAVTEFRSRVHGIVGLGIDDLRWPTPVRPGDTLDVHLEIADKRVSESRPGAGIVHERVTALNPDDDPVITFTNPRLIERR